MLSRRAMVRAAAAAVAGSALPLPTDAGRDNDERSVLRVVVFGAHPDDPETMAGGTAARFALLGHRVVCLYLTRGEAGIEGKTHDEAARIRTAEAEKACTILGTTARFAGQVDGATEVFPVRYDELRTILDDERPDLLITHWPVDTHRDHRAASLLAYDAWLRAGRRFDLYYGEVLSGEQTQVFAPTHWVDIDDVRARKREACFAHASQGPDEMWAEHEQMHVFRGREAGSGAAEAFVRHPRGRAGVTLP
jgi:LmbE family N-acetylglucosaminyl deacetylase